MTQAFSKFPAKSTDFFSAYQKPPFEINLMSAYTRNTAPTPTQSRVIYIGHFFSSRFETGIISTPMITQTKNSVIEVETSIIAVILSLRDGIADALEYGDAKRLIRQKLMFRR